MKLIVYFYIALSFIGNLLMLSSDFHHVTSLYITVIESYSFINSLNDSYMLTYYFYDVYV